MTPFLLEIFKLSLGVKKESKLDCENEDAVIRKAIIMKFENDFTFIYLPLAD